MTASVQAMGEIEFEATPGVTILCMSATSLGGIGPPNSSLTSTVSFSCGEAASS